MNLRNTSSTELTPSEGPTSNRRRLALKTDDPDTRPWGYMADVLFFARVLANVSCNPRLELSRLRNLLVDQDV